jgi:hypothetical protein
MTVLTPGRAGIRLLAGGLPVKKITRRQMLFARLYIERDFRSATEAYMQAYPGAAYETARANAARLLAKSNVQDYISGVIAEALGREKLVLEKRIFDYWAKRAFYDITEIIDLHGNLMIAEGELRARGLDACIDSINRKVDARGETVITYKFADKDLAAEMLQKYIQMVKPQAATVEIRGDDARYIELRDLILSEAGASDAAREEIIDGLAERTGHGLAEGSGHEA